ncbi:P-loop containing nucleoside triphosphate hydrolase protein [Fimicolochytrium jonesii]|uniref:P-loop containing nucleoside triphosphate hydrolase protein n=1 Tax=Fimicolochytrium jonesii TaxID=1396493 RepID=UPI0022FE8AD1|nr:P-loop containing nucleoside triphosphate hydrolase protein [Fimicolochytrium jonesii]KAI8820744.1 P-loop containing nucleoside triphosphate hydrolase protein [Fimicolochytrium jonesii]
MSQNVASLDVGRNVDLRHVQSSSGPKATTVDQRKLRAAEKKLAEKNAKRGLYDPDAIPVWNPDVKPALIVNQMKASGGAGSLSKDIKIENFDIAFAGKKILQSATLTLNHGRRYGLVGKNGIGKSTLLRAVAHKELQLPAHIRVLHVEQEMAGDDTPALDSVMKADVERTSLLEEEKTLSAKLSKTSTTTEDAEKFSKRLKEVYQRMEEIEADKAESKASAILNGLGFTPEQQRAPTRTFSGGWRMRLALASALFCKPDLLLADEVTNYLDFPAVVWLERYFQKWPATLLVVSHDRSFLDAVSTDILHLHDGALDYYRGNFSVFVGTKSERRRNQIREYEAQLQYRNHLQAFIDRWRYNAKRAAQAQSKIKILEKLPPLEAPPKDDMEGIAGEGQDIFFRFPDPEKLSPPILQVDDIRFGYTAQRDILNGVSFDLQMDSKIAVVGPNGAGKSTLIRLITGEVTPQRGIVQRHGRLRMALFSQHHVDQLELGASSVQFLQAKFPGMQEEEYRRVLGRYGLTGTTALQPIGTLSGGQKSRAVFAWMAMSNPHVLILDEPTNHLDMDSIDALASALREFRGGIAIVSHDERFLDAVCNEVWVCNEGKLTRFEGKTGNQDGVVKQYKASLMIDEV